MNYLSLYSGVLSNTYVKLSTILLIITITIIIFRKPILKLLERALLLLYRKVSLYNSKLNPDAMTVKLKNSDGDERFKEYYVYNNHLLESYDALNFMYNKLMNMEDFLEFGETKVLMVLVIIEGKIHSFHHNVVINNNTTFEQYYSKVEEHIRTKFDDGYGIDILNTFIVRVWDITDLRNANIKQTKDARVLVKKTRDFISTPNMHAKIRYISTTIPRADNYISPLKLKPSKVKPFFTMDIETMKSSEGDQIPVFISFSSKTRTEFFLINNSLPLSEAVNDLWIRFFNHIERTCMSMHGASVMKNKVNTVFIHNLGSFDGIFIYKFLANKFGNTNLKAILDDSNKFICISLKFGDKQVVFKDSYRILPVSLDDLCYIFNVSGKTSKYKEEFNRFNLFKNKSLTSEFIKYGCQDSRALHKALSSAQKSYFNNYNVDITSIVSIPSLAFKIFRLKYLTKDIPILSGLHDSFIRKSYYGGATDIYKCYAENVHYYDVNSLYPLAMCRPMPLNLIASYGTEERCKSININNFFGFLHVELECPSHVSRPMLPYKLNGRTIFPKGIFSGVYFSEELKAVLPLGYKILRIYSAREFSKEDVFTSYVNPMYNLKMVASGGHTSERWIAKLLLNSLYGLFGRRQDIIETITINKSELRLYLATSIVKTIIPVSNDKYTILIVKNINHDMIKQLNLTFHANFNEYNTIIKSNVAIASAVTAYARIHMIPYKLDESTVYTDTDSIFTTKPLNSSFLGKGLGQMKDELNGCTISKAYFLGIKQYGFWYIDVNGSRIEKSVWAMHEE